MNYTLDLNSGLTQVLNDGTNQYIYGLGRIAQVNTTTDYFLTDALGSARQLTNGQGQVTLANAYDPYGVLAQTAGSAQTSYGFTGEQTDPSGMVYLRARYYSSYLHPDCGCTAACFMCASTPTNPFKRCCETASWRFIGR
ncbi:MAG TPA: hypothetical protein PKK96_03575 [Anaerolineales bacterium]|nr:hypothetical protein [Anaerolineales bacterium]HNQ95591.1 hypothetical protein [Anaerolineales bacterium]HNS60062.1 hypothetical protein [Anaerolineales bacterium]